MSVETTDSQIVSLDSRLRDALMSMGRLTPEGAARVDKAMGIWQIRFADAAIQLGFITPLDLAKARQIAQQLPPIAVDFIVGEPQEISEEAPLDRGMLVKYVGTVKAGPSLILLHEPDNAYSEQIRALRTELLLLNGASDSGNVIVIVSPCRGEGRTQLCAELAIACSQLGWRTLLVDADLRRPRVHALFQSHNTLGLGQALASGGIPEPLSVEKLPHLSVLMAGPSVPNPLELLTNGHFQSQMSDWRQEYRMIIIDTPPISEFADGLAIASFAEQVVILGRTASTPHKNMKEMLRRLGGTQSRIVGAVINSF